MKTNTAAPRQPVFLTASEIDIITAAIRRQLGDLTSEAARVAKNPHGLNGEYIAKYLRAIDAEKSKLSGILDALQAADSYSEIVSAEPGTAPHEIIFTMGGMTAHAIGEAERSSFYGVHSGHPSGGKARRAITDAVSAYLDAAGISYYSYNIGKAHTIDTSGTPIPYRAKVSIFLDT